MPATNDEYVAVVAAEQREALERLRRAIACAAPDVEERISYGVPTFRLHGRMVVSFVAARRHRAFYPGAHPIAVHRDALATFETAKATVRFTPEIPLPAALIRAIVKTRVAEYTGETAARSTLPITECDSVFDR